MTSSADWELSRSATLDGDLVAAVQALSRAVELADGAPPLDEHAELQLSRAHNGTEHVLIRLDGAVLGYAQLQNLETVGDPGAENPAAEGPAAEILVGLDGDRSAVASALFDAAQDVVGSRALSVWARGETTPVRAEAHARGYDPHRTLLTMARPLADLSALGSSRLPDSVSIRAFVPGQDDAAWLAVNSRSFAHHPEQGHWTQADLDDRIAQPWFDPAGFLLLVEGSTVIGFHWTKLHAPETAGGPPVAEVYVIGLDPSAQGRKLSQPLLVAGLEYLQTTGAENVILYVDGENIAAVGLYEKTGFEISRRQTQYRRAGVATS